MIRDLLKYFIIIINCKLFFSFLINCLIYIRFLGFFYGGNFRLKSCLLFVNDKYIFFGLYFGRYLKIEVFVFISRFWIYLFVNLK